MPVSKPLTRLGLLGLFATAGLSACATWPACRQPLGACGTAPDAVVTSSPPLAEATTNPNGAAPPASAADAPDASGTPTISAPGPLVVVPPAAPCANSPANAPAASNPAPAPAPAPAAAPPAPAAPKGPPRTSDSTPDDALPAADSNRDEPHPQRPLDAAATADASTPGQQTGQQAAPDTAPLQTIPTAATGAPQGTASATANHPVGALAKLRARFHKLIQPSPKAAPKPSKDVKTADPAVPSTSLPPEPVASVRIPLPTSDAGRVVKDDPRTVHGLYSGSEDQGPIARVGDGDFQPGTPPDAPPVQAEGVPSQQTNGKYAGVEQIEPWPFGPKSAAIAPKAATSLPTTQDFDPMPVEEYRAAVARANGDGTSLPSFGQTASTLAPVASVSPAANQRATSTAETPQADNRPNLLRADQADQGLSSAQQASGMGSSSQRVELPNGADAGQSAPVTQPAAPQVDSTISAPSAGTVAPAVQLSPAPPAEPATAAIAARPVRSPQWIGGRYGQPAWMTPYLAPAAPRGQ